MSRDLAMLGDLARFRVLTTEQLRRRHFPDGAASTALNRLNKLKAAGYVTRTALAVGHGAVWLVTPKGAAASGTGLPAPRARTGFYEGYPAGYYHHHAIVADVAAALLTKAASAGVSAAWLTEAEWCRDQGLAVMRSPRPDGVLCLTAADGSVQRLAVEVERHPKPDRAYAAKFRWYRQQLAAGAFERVRWYCGDDVTLRHVQKHAAAAEVETRPLAALLATLEPVAA
jgi:hypothetical protein